MIGGAGADDLMGGAGADTIQGGEGNDTIHGGAGDDAVFGGTGNDLIEGGAGDDVLMGGAGADTFMFGADAFGLGVDTILDFDADGGDALNISEVLAGYDPLTDVISDFVEVNEDNGDFTVSVNEDGNGNDFIDVAVFSNTGDLGNITDLIDNGTIIV